MGNIYILFGGLTYLFVIVYGYMPKLNANIQSMAIFIIFSLMIILFGTMMGLLMKMLNKSNRFCEIAAFIFSFLLILLMFNVRGYLTYIYIPILLLLVQNRINLKLKI